MRIAIIGSGGVGGYFGAQLAARGEEVTFIARGEHLAAMRRSGLRVESGHAPAHIFPVNATDVIEEIGPVDLALVGVKLWDTDEVGLRLAPHLSPDSTVLSLQNGVSKDDILRKHLPASALVGGVCHISAAIASPGVIRHDGSLARIILGEFDGQRTARAMRIFECLTRAGVDAELSTSISETIWDKFVFLVALSSVTSATRQPVGALRRRERTRRLLHDAMAEVVRVGRARGIRLSPAYADQQIEFVDTLPEQMTSSMLNDLLHGRRLELPWLGESVVELARPLGIPTPVNELLAAVLDPYVAGEL
jgi:2-dehydropantoate 2-reductase